MTEPPLLAGGGTRGTISRRHQPRRPLRAGRQDGGGPAKARRRRATPDPQPEEHQARPGAAPGKRRSQTRRSPRRPHPTSHRRPHRQRQGPAPASSRSVKTRRSPRRERTDQSKKVKMVSRYELNQTERWRADGGRKNETQTNIPTHTTHPTTQHPPPPRNKNTPTQNTTRRTNPAPNPPDPEPRPPPHHRPRTVHTSHDATTPHKGEARWQAFTTT